ncbi:hypothetical protein [Rubricoccus marinus]|uniref:Lipopolysaccharide assembly protein A domain-containing protein n=1 Tax=Rubricoccus marinus TaxID=716817 RepID=A0A259TWX5_9BACT|nr:hypothetical protein [Rubricoccus marinus]OZC02200.1 hypothetical protein BSZ36_03875 [Rubricoccus marinus]
MRFAFVLIVLVALGGVLFATQPTNLEDIEFAIPFVSTTIIGIKLWTVLGAWVLGLFMGYLAAVPGAFSAKRRAKKLEKQMTAVQAQAGETAADARATAATARTPAARAMANETAEDASETQRLADEVARRTASISRDA